MSIVICLISFFFDIAMFFRYGSAGHTLNPFVNMGKKKVCFVVDISKYVLFQMEGCCRGS